MKKLFTLLCFLSLNCFAANPSFDAFKPGDFMVTVPTSIQNYWSTNPALGGITNKPQSGPVLISAPGFTGGGLLNQATGLWGATLGGSGNVGGGTNSVAMGFLSAAYGSNSLAFGTRAASLFDGTVIMSDGQNAQFLTTTNNQIRLRFQNGFDLAQGIYYGNGLGLTNVGGISPWSSNGTLVYLSGSSDPTNSAVIHRKIDGSTWVGTTAGSDVDPADTTLFDPFIASSATESNGVIQGLFQMTLENNTSQSRFAQIYAPSHNEAGNVFQAWNVISQSGTNFSTVLVQCGLGFGAFQYSVVHQRDGSNVWTLADNGDFATVGIYNGNGSGVSNLNISAGSNITLTTNGPNNTLQISATAGGSSNSVAVIATNGLTATTNNNVITISVAPGTTNAFVVTNDTRSLNLKNTASRFFGSNFTGADVVVTNLSGTGAYVERVDSSGNFSIFPYTNSLSILSFDPRMDLSLNTSSANINGPLRIGVGSEAHLYLFDSNVGDIAEPLQSFDGDVYLSPQGGSVFIGFVHGLNTVAASDIQMNTLGGNCILTGGAYQGNGSALNNLVTAPAVGHTNLVGELNNGTLTAVDITTVGGGGTSSTNFSGLNTTNGTYIPQKYLTLGPNGTNCIIDLTTNWGGTFVVAATTNIYFKFANVTTAWSGQRFSVVVTNDNIGMYGWVFAPSNFMFQSSNILTLTTNAGAMCRFDCLMNPTGTKAMTDQGLNYQ